jgi:hypothetical protein
MLIFFGADHSIKNINKKHCHANTEKKSLLQGDSGALITFSIDIKYISVPIGCYNESIAVIQIVYLLLH